MEKAGRNVLGFKKGDKVFGRPSMEENGSYAEYIVVKSNEVALMPKTSTYDEAATIPVAGTAAWDALMNKGKIHKGQRVLILAASGGVGSLAVQIAKNIGCYVIGTTSKANVNFVRDLGATEVIDYLSEDFSERLTNIDMVLDTIGGTVQERAFRVLRKGGVLVSTAQRPDQELAIRYGVKAEFVFVGPDAHILNELKTLIEMGQIKPVIDKIFKFDEVKQAQNYSQSGKACGKIVLEVAS